MVLLFTDLVLIPPPYNRISKKAKTRGLAPARVFNYEIQIKCHKSSLEYHHKSSVLHYTGHILE